MRAFLMIAGMVHVACQDRPDTYIVPLAEFDAEAQLGGDDRIFATSQTLRLVADHEPCLVLSPRNTRVTLEGIPGEMDPGNPEYSNRDCYGPAMIFDNVPSKTGAWTFEITDGSATWTFVMWEPFAYPRFELVSTAPARVGQPVLLHIDLYGPMTSASVEARDANRVMLFELDETSGVAINGNELSFVLPQVPAGTVELYVRAEHQIRIDRCDAPRGCRPEAGQGAFSSLDLVVAP